MFPIEMVADIKACCLVPVSTGREDSSPGRLWVSKHVPHAEQPGRAAREKL